MHTSGPTHTAVRPWMVIYAVCLVFVTSFILFEVLDVDGSDFPRPAQHLAVKVEEASHDHLKRAGLAVPPALAVTWFRLSEVPAPPPIAVVAPVLPARAPVSRETRTLLPRAVLPDRPAAA